MSDANKQVHKVLSDALSEKLKDMGKLIALQQKAKTGVKKKYLQNKIDAKKNLALKYMFEISNLEASMEKESNE